MHRNIKTIHGIEYVYEQTSYRENGKVKTVSRYLGPVSVVGRPQKDKSKNSSGGANMPKRREKERSRKKDSPSSLTCPARLLDKWDLSKDRIYHAQKHLEEVCKRQGLGEPVKIRVKRGIGVLQVNRVRGGYTVRLPLKRSACSRNAVRKAIFQAQGRAHLLALKTSKPEQYEKIRKQFEQAEKNRRIAISHWWKHTNSYSKTASAFMAKRYGNFVTLQNLSFAKQKPEKMGLIAIDHPKRFEDQFAALYANLLDGGKGKRTKHGFRYSERVTEAWGDSERNVHYFQGKDGNLSKIGGRFGAYVRSRYYPGIVQSNALKRARWKQMGVEALYHQTKVVESLISI